MIWRANDLRLHCIDYILCSYVGCREGIDMDLARFIATFIGNLFCYTMGYIAARKSIGAKLFGRSRAWIKVYKNGDTELRAEILGDDIKMMHALCHHLEGEGYNMDDVQKEFFKAMIKGNMPKGSDGEDE